MKRIAALAVLSLLAGCATPSATVSTRPHTARADVYDPLDFAWSTRGGSAVIRGKVAYATRQGGAYSCAGGSVGLTPAAPISAKRIARLYGDTVRAVRTVEEVKALSAGEAQPAYGEFVRNARCDAQGRFVFEGLPGGDWFIVARAKSATGQGPDLVFMAYVEAPEGRARDLTLR